jgi:hypothetical protein
MTTNSQLQRSGCAANVKPKIMRTEYCELTPDGSNPPPPVQTDQFDRGAGLLKKGKGFLITINNEFGTTGVWPEIVPVCKPIVRWQLSEMSEKEVTYILWLDNPKEDEVPFKYLFRLSPCEYTLLQTV